MRPWNNRENRRGAGSIQKCLKLRTASTSSSERSTNTEMGLVDVCAILCDNSEAFERERATGEPVAAVAEGREGGPITLDLPK